MDLYRQAVVLEMDDGSSFEATADIVGWEPGPPPSDAPPRETWTAKAWGGEGIVPLPYLVDDVTGTLRIPARGEYGRFQCRYTDSNICVLKGTEAVRSG